MLPERKTFVPVTSGEVLLGYADTELLSRIRREEWPVTQVGDVYVPLDENNAVSLDTPAAELMEKISATSRRKFLVANGRQLLGVITLTDLMGYLEVLQEVRLVGGKATRS